MLVQQSKSAGGVVVNKEGKVLVVYQDGRVWSLPKGKINPGEDSMSAARREIYEESGVKDLTLVRPLLTYTRFKIGLDGRDIPSVLKVIEMFLFRTDFSGELKTSREIAEARWVSKEEVADLLTHPKDKEFFRKVMFEI